MLQTDEVLVDGDRRHATRNRESWEDLIRGESMPDFVQGAARL